VVGGVKVTKLGGVELVLSGPFEKGDCICKN